MKVWVAVDPGNQEYGVDAEAIGLFCSSAAAEEAVKAWEAEDVNHFAAYVFEMDLPLTGAVLERKDYGFLTGVVFGFPTDALPTTPNPEVEVVLSTVAWANLGEPSRIEVAVKREA